MKGHCLSLAVSLTLVGCHADPNNPKTQSQMLVGEWRLIHDRILVNGDHVQNRTR
jgi:uncharacterized protein YcfL